RMTDLIWRSAFVAALFALHPLHVESVAWVAERKDVLCAFFWILTLWVYCLYAARPSLLKYLCLLPPFLLGLMSKPMIVTLPFILLLMDWWPLQRIKDGNVRENGMKVEQFSLGFLVVEKIPLFLLSALSAVTTVIVQMGSGAVKSFEWLPLNVRAANAVVSYILYIKKMLWPLDLAVFYPHPGMPSLWMMIAAIVLLLVLTLSVILCRRSVPYLLTGWFWYLGTLVPVIGIVQVGSQAMADRYTYIPLIGIAIMLAWGIPEFFRMFSIRARYVLAVAAVFVLISFGILAHIQVGYWRNSITLFRHALAVTTDNSIAHNNLGVALSSSGSIEEAAIHYRQALRIRPHYADAHFNLANYFYYRKAYEQATLHYKYALSQRPEFAKANRNLGMTLAALSRHDEALSQFREALRKDPEDEEAALYIGDVLIGKGAYEKAIEYFEELLQRQQPSAEIYNDLGIALLRSGRINEAIDRFRKALEIRPDFMMAKENLSLAVRLRNKRS
ncbi:MAG: tetratricopeptide repeat protein, partial [Deltaproteobacteria bacterium]|nr:tetratricopeptide repeat protein [Deltaproteobacteria bacterium]